MRVLPFSGCACGIDPLYPATTCGRGGIGRRAALRSLWANPRGSSSLLDRTIPSFGDYRRKKRCNGLNVAALFCFPALDVRRFWFPVMIPETRMDQVMAAASEAR